MSYRQKPAWCQPASTALLLDTVCLEVILAEVMWKQAPCILSCYVGGFCRELKGGLNAVRDNGPCGKVLEIRYELSVHLLLLNEQELKAPVCKVDGISTEILSFYLQADGTLPRRRLTPLYSMCSFDCLTGRCGNA